MKIKNTILSVGLLFTITMLMPSCGSSATEDDLKKAEESAKELENIDYDNVEMPEADTEPNTEEEEEFDADAMLE